MTAGRAVLIFGHSITSVCVRQEGLVMVGHISLDTSFPKPCKTHTQIGISSFSTQCKHIFSNSGRSIQIHL